MNYGTAQGQLAVVLNEHYADLKASLVGILCLEAEGSNCNFVPHGSKKIRCANNSKLLCAVPIEEIRNSFKGDGGGGGRWWWWWCLSSSSSCCH